MNKSVKADLVSFVRQLALAMEPIAQAEDIRLSFKSPLQSVVAVFNPGLLAADITGILSKLIELTPEQESISVTISMAGTKKSQITIQNTGINLGRANEVVSSCRQPVTVIAHEKDTTRYELEVDLFDDDLETAGDELSTAGDNFVPDYYVEIRKRLRSHFVKADNLVAALEKSSPREAAFLVKVNAVISSNLENSQFDANKLSELMNMSRTQLFRRLKPIIKESPGSYIRQIKLQKAKELFETTDLRISEVAYRTGFETASHFTKVFTKKYGVKPSLFCRRHESATNE